FCGSNLLRDFTVLEPLCDEFDNPLLGCTGCSLSKTLCSEHICLRYSMVASFTRFIPPVIPNRINRRLKCAVTVRRAIWSCPAISELSQPWSSNSVICCSLGPSRIDLSFIALPLVL